MAQEAQQRPKNATKEAADGPKSPARGRKGVPWSAKAFFKGAKMSPQRFLKMWQRLQNKKNVSLIENSDVHHYSRILEGIACAARRKNIENDIISSPKGARSDEKQIKNIYPQNAF